VAEERFAAPRQADVFGQQSKIFLAVDGEVKHDHAAAASEKCVEIFGASSVPRRVG